MVSWESLLQSAVLPEHLREQGYVTPTAIQAASLPYASKHRIDLIIASQTGTGKTLCFAIPIIERITPKSGSPQALILTPTRELALQIESHLSKINLNQAQLLSLVGGIAIEKQIRLLKRQPDIIIATPGRLWEIISEKKHPFLAKLPLIDILVIDEADKMVETGHFRELDSILSFIYAPNLEDAEEIQEVKREKVVDLNFGQEILLESSEFYTKSGGFDDIFVKNIEKIEVPKQKKQQIQSNPKRQTFLLSATLTSLPNSSQNATLKKKKTAEISPFDRLMQKIQFRGKPKVIDLTQGQKLPSLLTERVVKCNSDEKDSFLYYFLKDKTDQKCIIFVNTIIVARKITHLLRILGFKIVHLDGKMRQGKRLKQLDRFKAECNILIATDVAGRGLDLPEVQNVIHYNLPRSAEVYIHRSGRTARIQHTGFSLAVVGPMELKTLQEIQKAVGEKIPKLEVDFRKWQECVRAVKVASELLSLEKTDEFERKNTAWERHLTDESELHVDPHTSEPKATKRRKLALKDSLATLQASENRLRGSVISPEMYREAKARRLI